jgi:putative membrane protein
VSDLPRGIRRPDRRLAKYYVLQALATGPAFPFVLAFRLLRFRTLRYEFDDEGLSVRWGMLFRREISLTFERIQDLHLVSNVVERWLGLGRIQVQTASGSAKAEMTIEGLPDVDGLRDALYARMRGARDADDGRVEVPVATLDEVARALRDTAAALRSLSDATGPPQGTDDVPA